MEEENIDSYPDLFTSVMWYAIEIEGVKILTPFTLNQQVLRKIRRQGPTVKVVKREMVNKLYPFHFSLLKSQTTEVKVSRVA